MPAHVPEEPQSSREPECVGGLVRLKEPLESGPKVAELALEPVKPRPLIGTDERLLGALGESQVVLGVPLTCVHQITCRQSRLSERLQRIQKMKPRFAIDMLLRTHDNVLLGQGR